MVEIARVYVCPPFPRVEEVVASELRVAAHDVILSRGRCGRPTIRAPRSQFAISVSHADGLTLVATARGREVGVDVEPSDRDVADWALWRRVLSEPELARFSGDGPSLLRAWASKEAVAKASGLGLQVDLRAIETGDAGLDALPESLGRPEDWSLTHLHIPGYVAAVACSPPVARVEVVHR